VSALDTYNPDGCYPVLVSGSRDHTCRVWDLSSMTLKFALEGHHDDLTCLKIFCPGGSDPSVASGSIDETVRVLFDFLESVPDMDA
ncbi:hypothetical protein B484DRAFT_411016, partial [Ochromonadaceae sp. CCMP2298]